jgi:hypothetical protein
MSWTSPQDVIDRWVGPGIPTDQDLVQALIDDAESIVLAEYPRIQERIDAGTLPLTTVVMVVCRMATRLLRNPDAVSYWQQTTGPFGQARNFGDNTDIWLTDNEKALLGPNKAGKAYSLDLAPNKTAPDYYPFEAPETRAVWREAGI